MCVWLLRGCSVTGDERRAAKLQVQQVHRSQISSGVLQTGSTGFELRDSDHQRFEFPSLAAAQAVTMRTAAVVGFVCIFCIFFHNLL